LVAEIVPDREQGSTHRVAHIQGSGEDLEKKGEKNRRRKRHSSDSESSILPESKREGTILDTLLKIRDFQPSAKSDLLPRLRELTSQHPDLDLLRIARELSDWFDTGNGAKIQKRTWARFANWVRRIAADPERVAGYGYDPRREVGEEIKRKVLADEEERKRRERAAREDADRLAREKRIPGQPGNVGVDSPVSGSDPGSGDSTRDQRGDAQVALSQVQSLVAGPSERMGRRPPG